MKRSFKFLIVALMLALSPSLWADDGVILQLHDGTSVGFAFDKVPVVKTDTAATLLIKTSDGQSVSYDYDNIRKFYLGDVSATGINNVSKVATKAVFRTTENGIEVYGLAEGEKVSVYTPNGVLVSKATSTGNQITLALPKTESVYIAHTSNGVSFKFINK